MEGTDLAHYVILSRVIHALDEDLKLSLKGETR